MTYTVTWTARAEQDLAAIWLAALDRDAVTLSAHEVDLRLRTDPTQEGESRVGNRRITFVAPLGVEFRVVEDDRMVFVVLVRAI